MTTEKKFERAVAIVQGLPKEGAVQPTQDEQLAVGFSDIAPECQLIESRGGFNSSTSITSKASCWSERGMVPCLEINAWRGRMDVERPIRSETDSGPRFRVGRDPLGNPLHRPVLSNSFCGIRMCRSADLR